MPNVYILSRNTLGNMVGLGFHDQTLAVKSRKMPENYFFIFLLVMPKYGEKPNFSFLSGSKAMNVEEREKKVSVNNGQTIDAWTKVMMCDV